MNFHYLKVEDKIQVSNNTHSIQIKPLKERALEFLDEYEAKCLINALEICIRELQVDARESEERSLRYIRKGERL